MLRTRRDDQDAIRRHHVDVITGDDRQGPITINAKLFDGENTPQNIAMYGFILGSIWGCGFIFTFFLAHHWHVEPFGLLLMIISLFHLLEYVGTAMSNPSNLNLDSFLINHSAHYHLAHAVSIVEYAIEYYFWPQHKALSYLTWAGLVLVMIGQIIRTLAMLCAGHNFSHHIQGARQRDHTLVTTGIYGVMRHPSYFGFYLWALGVQLVLFNPVCLGLYVYWLHKFFKDRIAYEEETLRRFFGEEWQTYKTRVPTWIPLIP